MRGSGLVRTTAAAIFAVAVWRANSSVCPDCAIRDVAVPTSGGTVRGTLYMPAGVDAAVPVVLVSHGYLASRRFLTIPWAADITRLGAAALLIDRRGHGDSDGAWWPPPPREIRTPDELMPDLAGTLVYLRGLEPLVDPWRIALLGHSDGGTAALLAASADWDVRATVGLSPSPTAWEFLNHVSPRNLLLIFGADDDIVPPEGRTMLIGAATRGYLAGPGRTGDLARGSARELMVVPAAAHVSVLYADVARLAALTWIAHALGLTGPVRLSHLRFDWIWTGLIALQAVLWWPRGDHNGWPAEVANQRTPRGRRFAGAGIAASAWVAGLSMASWVAQAMPELPAQETAMLGGVLVSASAWLALSAYPLARLSLPPPPDLHAPDWHRICAGICRGAAHALAALAGLHLLCWHVAACPFDKARIALWGFYALCAVPFFAILDTAARWATGSRATSGSALALAALPLLLGAPFIAPRMGVVPIYWIVATMFLLALSLMGGVSSSWGVSGRAVFGALFLGRVIAATCPLY